ncbi:MAG: YggT family protein [Thermoclostridium sp.]|nr:YggT family protein [Thermoclostridium sp.]
MEHENDHHGKVIPMHRVHSDGTTVFQEDKPLWFVRSRNVIYYLLGLIEILLGLRFLFMLLGANPRSGFTSFLYMFTGIFISPFSGIFNPLTTPGLVSRSVFDPATIVAMIIYALIAWGIVRLMWIKVARDD